MVLGERRLENGSKAINTLLTIWFYGSALILAAYWSVVIRHLFRGLIPARDLTKSIGISLLAVLLWPYLLVRWFWMLLRGDLTQDVILDPLDNTANQRARDQDENS